MGAGDLTLTNYGSHSVSGASLKTAVDSITLAAATDFLFLVPIANGTQVQVIGVAREADA